MLNSQAHRTPDVRLRIHDCFSHDVRTALPSVHAALFSPSSRRGSGGLTLVYALRNGKATVVSPLTNAGAPLIPAVIALVLLGLVPHPLKILGIVLAFAADRRRPRPSGAVRLRQARRHSSCTLREVLTDHSQACGVRDPTQGGIA
jgi:hypothetical protein